MFGWTSKKQAPRKTFRVAERGEATRLENPAIAKLRTSSKQSARAMSRMLALTIVLLLIAGLAVFISMAQSASTSTTASDPNIIGTTVPGRAEATVAATQFLSPDNMGVTGYTLLGWTGAVKVPNAAKTTGTSALQKDSSSTVTASYTQLFDVQYETTLLTLSVQTSVTASGGVTITSQPSLSYTGVTIQANSTGQDGSVPAGWSQAQAPDATKTSIGVFGKALFGGDGDALRVALGDQQDRTYTPIPGFDYTSAAIQTAWSNDADTGTNPPQTIVARAIFTVTPQGQASSALSTAKSVTLAFDVLIQNAQSASPVIVAWGFPGSGFTLQPFGNGQNTSASPLPQPTVTATPSAATTSLAPSTDTATSAPTSTPTDNPSATEIPAPYVSPGTTTTTSPAATEGTP